MTRVGERLLLVNWIPSCTRWVLCNVVIIVTPTYKSISKSDLLPWKSMFDTFWELIYEYCWSYTVADMNTVWLWWYFGPKRNIFPRKLAPLPGIWPGACAIPLTGPINWHSTAIVWRFNCLIFLMLMMVEIRARWFQIIDMDFLASPQTGPITERNTWDNMALGLGWVVLHTPHRRYPYDIMVT